MFRLITALFGVRITVIYRNGAKARMRARKFDLKWGQRAGSNTKEITRAEWVRPILSWSREPMFLNVDEIVAVWQGRA